MADFPAFTTGAATTLSQASVSVRDTKSAAGIRHAAGEFESILLNQWLEGAESTFGSVPGGDGDEDAGDGQIKSFAVQALAKGITAAGGIGLGKLVSAALTAHQHCDENGAAPTAQR